jgi:serine/threonine protein kinase/WD40 repeat protein
MSESGQTIPHADGGPGVREDPDGASEAWPTFPGYELLEELGRGGVGVVYRARHTALNRVVAVKVLKAAAAVDWVSPVRFRAEAEVVARLQHPNIVQIFEVGEHHGLPFLALEFVNGGSLEKRLAGTPLPALQAAQLTEVLARAVHAAHEQGVVHRDLKPANILLTADGVPKVTDFGLAKRLDSPAGPTCSGHVLGTPSYMAPEQAQGRVREVGPASDVYALGAILYECLTGRPPFRAANMLGTLAQVVSEEPVPPTRLQPRMPRDLGTVCLKCLEKDPGKRYPSARELADDLRRFLDGKPVRARPVGPLARFARWSRRNPILAGVSTLAVLALLAVTVISILFALYQKEALGKSEESQRRLEEADRRRRRFTRLSVKLALERGQQLCQQGEVAQGVLWLARALELAEDADLRRVCRANLAGWRLHLPRLKAAVACSPDESEEVFVSPDGKALLKRRVGRWYATPAGRRILAAVPQGGVQNWILSPNRKVVFISVEGMKWARFWDLTTGKPLGQPLPIKGEVLAAAFSGDGKFLVTVSYNALDADDDVRVWETAAPRPVGGPFRNARTFVSCVAVGPGGKAVLLGYKDGRVRLREAVTGKPLREWSTHRGTVTALAFSPDGKTLISGSSDGTVHLSKAAGKKPVRVTLRLQGRIVEASLSLDGRAIFTGSQDHGSLTARLWEVARGQSKQLLHEDRPGGIPLAFGPHGKTSLWDEDGRMVRLRATATGRPVGKPVPLPIKVVERPRMVVVERFVALGPDGKTAFVFSPGKSNLWDLTTGQRVGQPLALENQPRAAAFSPDGKVIAVADGDRVRRWDVATGRPHGRPLVVGGPLRKAASGGAPKPDRPAVLALSFSPNGRGIALGCDDQTARLWDAVTGRPIGVELPHRQPLVNKVIFSPDGKTILTCSHSGSGQGEAQLWDTATGRLIGSPLRHPLQRPVVAAAFRPDGQAVATGTCDDSQEVGDVRLWDPATGNLLGPPLQFGCLMLDLAFDRDGKTLLTLDPSVQAWKLWGSEVGAPERVTLWAQVTTGMELDQDGVLRILPVESWEKRRRRLKGWEAPPLPSEARPE